MTIRYPGAVWMPTARRGGHRNYRRSNPLLVLHTRESPRVGGTYPWPPHMSIDLNTGEVHQHVEFHSSAYAMRHSQPNRRGGRPTYQVELVGYARDTPHYSDEWYAALADLVSWFHHNLGVPLAFPKPFAGSDAYGLHGSVRTTSQGAWDALTGIVGHQHAYDNSHWDPGKLDVTRLRHFLDGESHTPDHAPEPEAHHDLTEHPEGTVTIQVSLPIIRHVRPNTRSQHVKNLQALLNAHGASLVVDGAYGPDGEKAVKTFQADHHLTVDGVVSTGTWRALL